MSQITSHVLDTTRGQPAAGIPITLLRQMGDEWLLLGSGETDEDGRVVNLTGTHEVLAEGTYRLTFHLSDYYARQQVRAFYPQADVSFDIEGDGQHYHVPLLLNPYGYSTYRGS